MSKKKLDIEEIAGELRQSPLSNNPLKGSVFFDKKPLDKVEKKEHDEDMKPASKTDSRPAIKIDSKLDSYIDSMLADIGDYFISHKVKGVRYSEVSFARLTKEEKQDLRDIVNHFVSRGIKTNENEIVRMATKIVLADYQDRKLDSLIARLLASIYK